MPQMNVDVAAPAMGGRDIGRVYVGAETATQSFERRGFSQIFVKRGLADCGASIVIPSRLTAGMRTASGQRSGSASRLVVPVDEDALNGSIKILILATSQRP